MALKKLFGLAAIAVTADLVVADTLYVANYANSVTQLTLSGSKIEAAGVTRDCGINPSWLELDEETGTLLCLDEAYTLPATANNSAISTYALSSTPPSLLGNASAVYGPVFSTVYAPGRVAVAQYSGSSVEVFDISDPGAIVPTQIFTYTLPSPGPVPSRQEAPHPHQILPDPTGKFLVAPDLGADYLRLYSVADDSSLVELTPFSVLPGLGPRHGTFNVIGNKTFYYLLGELGNGLAGYEVTYSNDTINFDQFYLDSTLQNGYGYGALRIAPAEIYAPESTHLILSLRNDSTSTFEGQPSDTLVTYDIDQLTGNVTLLGKSPAGGSYPRGFELNANGTLVAVATQYTGRLSIFPRNTTTGLVSSTPLATWETTEKVAADNSSLVSVVWA